MTTLDRDAKKAALVDILYWDHLLDTQVLEQSKLAQLSNEEKPVVLEDGYAWLVLGAWGLGMFALAGLYGLQNNIDYLQPLAVIGFVLVVAMILRRMLINRSERIKTFRGLCDAFEELKTQQQSLSTYLTELDERTSRYFHCVTTSKVTTYYLLSQVLQQLNDLVDLVEPLLAKDDIVNMNEAYDALVGSVTISDGLVACSGQEHSVPVARVGVTVERLTEQLEEGLRELETEINYFRSSEESPRDSDDTLITE